MIIKQNVQLVKEELALRRKKVIWLRQRGNLRLNSSYIESIVCRNLKPLLKKS